MSASTAQRPWYADGLCFECTQCGACCSGAPGYVWVSIDEAERIATQLGLSSEDFFRKHVRRVGRRFSLLEKKDGDCEFLTRDSDGKTRCGIYHVRPVQCRTWPFWKSNVRTPQDWKETGRACPGVDRGTAIHPLPAIQAALAANRDLPL